MLYAKNGMTMSDWRAYNLGRFLAVAEMAADGDYRDIEGLIADLREIRTEYLRDETHTQPTNSTLEKKRTKEVR